jgi:DNA-binding CsgD family transcriptional regulator
MFKIHIKIFILIIYFNVIPQCQPTNLGHPPIFNYYKKDTRAGTQTWGITEDNLGYIYFGNNAGLVKFDGYKWEVYSLPYKTLLRSLTYDTLNQRIYVGSQGEFGYFSHDKNGKFIYHSISQQLPAHARSFGEVWHTLNTKYGIFFRTDHQVYKYFNGTITPMFKEYVSLNFIAEWGSEIVVQDSNNKLYNYNGEKFILRPINNSFPKGKISAVINLNKTTTIITTLHHGIFKETKNGFEPWVTPYDDFLKKNVIYCAVGLKDEKIALGTSYDGMIVLNKNGEIESHINKSHKLQNNTVLSIFGTKSGNVWVGLDNGIDLVHRNSYFRVFYPDNILQGTGYTSALYNNTLYLGTNSGLYKIPWKLFYPENMNYQFTLVPNSQGQVWNLQIIESKLWMAHHEGAFNIINHKAEKISGTSGIWKFSKYSKNHMVAGYYEGLLNMNYSNNKWNVAKIKGYDESSRFLIQDDDQNIWVSHPYRGIFKITKDEISNLNTKGFKLNPNISDNAKLKNYIFQIENEIYGFSDQSFFKLDSKTNTFKKDDALGKYINVGEGLKFLEVDNFKNIWYATSTETGILIPAEQFNTTYKKYLINELNNRLTEGFQSVMTIDKYNVIIPTESGFLHFNPEGYINETEPIKIFVSKIILKSNPDSILFCKSTVGIDQPQKIILNHEQNEFEINLAVFDHPNKNLVEYSYRVNEGNFSPWSNKPDISFNQLSPGNYNIEIKAKNQTGIESKAIKFEILVNPPWHKSKLAYLIYILLIGLFLKFLSYKQKKMHNAEKKSIIVNSQIREQEHLMAVQESQEKIIRLQNENLQAELAFKNQELTSYTYHLVSKNELIAEIKKAIQKLGPKFANDKELKREFKTIIQLTDQNSAIDNDWDNFIKSFDQVHSEFFKRLTEKYPNLSSNDYKMCTYLRMNLTSKEISALMNISLRSVETNRYRLRKKLGLHSEANLTQYLLRY